MHSSEHEDARLEVLRDIASQPTAPFHEGRVAARVGTLLRTWGLPFTVDDYGNIVAHYRCGAPCRPLTLMAHMDHPAFTVVAAAGPGGAGLTARLEGGVAAGVFDRPVAVRIFPRAGTASTEGLPARTVGYQRGQDPRDVEIYLDLDDPGTAGQVQSGDFGVWDLPALTLRDGVIHACALDDLIGCAAILLTLQALARDQPATDVYGVFTRAEEVGLIGAQAVMSGGLLPPETYVVSLEASKALPGALQGAGPVIRVGDRASTFSDAAELVLRAAATRLDAGTGSGWRPVGGGDIVPITVQRQLMSGGRCEGSAALQHGYTVTGLAFPLGNYHNVSDDLTLAPETVHAADFLAGVALLDEAARLMPDLPRLQAERAAAYHRREDLLARLKETAGRVRDAV